MRMCLGINLKLSLFIGLILIGITNAGDVASDREEILRLEKAWNDAHLQGDADTLATIWADDMVVIVPKMPVMTKPQLIAFVRSGRMIFHKYETSEVKLSLYGEAAVVTGRLVRERMINNNDVTDDWRFTKVYIRRNDKWQVVSWQASESPEQ